MKTVIKETTSYAQQNTADVVTALKAYHTSAEVLGNGLSLRAAISSYEKATGKRVTDRTVRRWLTVAKNYGGLDRIPGNAFGSLKSCPHSVLSKTERVQAIEKECDRILNVVQLTKRETAIDLVELTRIDQTLRERVRFLRGNKPSEILSSIKENARLIETLKSPSVRIYIPGTEKKTTLGDILPRLENITRRPMPMQQAAPEKPVTELSAEGGK